MTLVKNICLILVINNWLKKFNLVYLPIYKASLSHIRSQSRWFEEITKKRVNIRL